MHLAKSIALVVFWQFFEVGQWTGSTNDLASEILEDGETKFAATRI